MTDTELNREIKEILIKHSIWLGYFDFRDWNNLMELVEEYKLTLIYDELTDTWDAIKEKSDEYDTYYEINNPCPKRALAECLLKTLQEKFNHE